MERRCNIQSRDVVTLLNRPLGRRYKIRPKILLINFATKVQDQSKYSADKFHNDGILVSSPTMPEKNVTLRTAAFGKRDTDN